MIQGRYSLAWSWGRAPSLIALGCSISLQGCVLHMYPSEMWAARRVLPLLGLAICTWGRPILEHMSLGACTLHCSGS